MASNYGNLEYGAWVHQSSNGAWEQTGHYDQGAGDRWAWFRGEPSWNLGFLHTYPMTMFLGVIISFLTVAFFWKRMKYSWDLLYILVIIIVPTSILGARLWFLIASGSNANWSEFFKFSGLSIQGGVMASGTAACIFVWTKRHMIDFRTVVGIILPAVIIGQAIGRWGNFDNHEVYGAAVKESSLNWLTFIKPHMLIINDRYSSQPAEYRHPFFFYESMFNLLGYLVLVWVLLRKNWVKPGVTAALYLIYYGVTRIIMEPLRDPSDIMKIGNFPTSILIAGIWIFAGLILFVWWQGLTRPFDKVVTKILPKSLLEKFKKEYQTIYPVKPRRVFFVGQTVEYKKSILMYWGKEKPNKVKLYIPVTNDPKWSKKELNQGFKNKK